MGYLPKLSGLVLVLFLAGCQTMPAFFQPPADTCASCAATSTERATLSSQSKAAGPRPPQTLPHALCAYWKCLHMPTSPAGDEAKKTADDGEPAKNAEKKASPESETDKKSDEKAPAAGKQQETDKKEKDGSDKKDDKREDKKEDKKDDKSDEVLSWLSGHAQATMVTQVHDHFHSPYSGRLSLQPVEGDATSVTATLFLDARLWDNGGYSGDLVFDPELAGGKGLSAASGIAGFTNGEITRVGVVDPTPYIARLYLRQTVALGGEQEKIEDGPNQLARSVDLDRFTLYVGKLSVTDLVDDNRYSHDPRTQFLNWSIMFNGAWDYPANVRGYTYGVGLDLNQKTWALRYGIYAEPATANGAELDPHFLKANGQFLELEERYKVCDAPGKLRLMAYLNHADMGNYSQALAEMPVDPNIALTRSYRFKYGFTANLEQEITKNLGVFVRLGWNDGHSESWAFTEIDRTASFGAALKGARWCRPNDTVGLAAVFNGLAAEHREYLAAGGYGFIIGDGALNYGAEETFEFYYDWQIAKGINAAFDFQEVDHPAYNRDRGPVSVFTLRVHLEF